MFTYTDFANGDITTVEGTIITWFYSKSGFSKSLEALDKISNNYFSNLKEDGLLPANNKSAVFLQLPNLKAKKIIVINIDDSDLDRDFLVKNQQEDLELIKKFARILSKNISDNIKLAKSDKYHILLSDELSSLFVKQCLRFVSDNLYSFKLNFKNDNFVENDFNNGFNINIINIQNQYDLNKIVENTNIYRKYSQILRNLANSPANICTPDFFCKQALEQSKDIDNLTVKYLEPDEIRKENMLAFLGVAQGSQTPARFLILEYKNKNAKNLQKPLVLIGKGITFDSGGISLKPSAEMDLMKFDMCGAATVLASILAAAKQQVNLHIVALMPLAENIPGGKSYKPSDVLNSKSGKLIEVLNTDAEGRLILCDAITYACQHYKPMQIIDIATLTGACVIALGSVYAGLFSNDEKMSENLFQAGQITADLLWKMPTDNDYREMMKSKIADIANISGSREAGACTAAAFLEEFVEENIPWAHLDIAGVAWKSGSEKTSTGRPFAAVLEYIRKLAEA